MTPAGVVIRAMTADDAPAYRALRLEALADAPEAFGAAYEEEAALSLHDFRLRIPAAQARSAIFIALDGARPVGMAGLDVSERVRTRHSAWMWGVYVAREMRGRGLGRALAETVIARARAHVVVLRAGVSSVNATARDLYLALGFEPYGLERRALWLDGAFIDEEMLQLDLDRT